MFCKTTLGSKLFPTIGFLTINEQSSLEDLPDLETNKLANRTTTASSAIGQIATINLINRTGSFHEYFESIIAHWDGPKTSTAP